MSQPDFQAIGLIVSSLRGVFRVGPNGEKEALIAKLPPPDEITITARSLIPSRGQYPNGVTLAEMVKQQQNRGLERLIG